MMEIGAGWLKAKKDKSGAEVRIDGRKVMNISAAIKIPFLGEINVTLIRVTEKKNDKGPDYLIYWFPDDAKKGQARKQGSDAGGEEWDS